MTSGKKRLRHIIRLILLKFALWDFEYIFEMVTIIITNITRTIYYEGYSRARRVIENL